MFVSYRVMMYVCVSYRVVVFVGVLLVAVSVCVLQGEGVCVSYRVMVSVCDLQGGGVCMCLTG